MTSPASFDPVAYKATTLRQWEQAADAWHAWGHALETWLGPATETMLDAAGVRAGSAVLDVAAGAGGQTLAAARRVGPTGRVLATDISPQILAFAEREAHDAGLTWVSAHVLDGEDLDVEPGSFDAVISRVGFIYFPDQRRAFTGMLRALRTGGYLAGIVYSTPEANPFFSIPVSVIRRRAGLPPPLPEQPGPFSFGAPGVAEAAFERAGFVEVRVQTIAAPLRMTSTEDCVRFEQESFGALHQMLAGLDDAGRTAAWAEISERLSEFDGADGFVCPCELLVASGRRP
ncbi:MAG TPA: class I SAM-dependent methyltransferase [Jatrophihabitantaceae bacterium]|nr:class I SAM-dependent methyltransferase [Jatrophihabitantaceae bacterium]